jgi:hypothetical protein
MLQRIELILQHCILGMCGQALGGNGHGSGFVTHAAQNPYPLPPCHGLGSVTLQIDQLFKR